MLEKPESIEEILPALNSPMPWDDDSEKAVLAVAIQNPVRLTSHLATMPPDLFYHEANKAIFTTIVDEVIGGVPVDPITVTRSLRESGKLDMAGGAAFISELYTNPVPASHFEHHLGVLKGLYAQRRQIEAFGRSLRAIMRSGYSDLENALDAAKGYLEEAGRVPGQMLKAHSIREAIDPLLIEIEKRSKLEGKLPGIPTGFRTIDQRTGGMMPGQVWVFAGEPGDGKSTIMQNLAENAAQNDKIVRWYPLEMPMTEQTFRILSSAAQVDNENLYSGKLTHGEHQAIQSAIIRLRSQKIHIVDVEDASATDIFADIEKSNADVVVVDYLQLLDDTSARKSDTRETVLASISRRQKSLARRTGKVILTASQLNDNGRLRESRAIGQDADKVFLTKKYEIPDKDPRKKTSETGFDDGMRTLWCDKNRGGRRHWELHMKFIGSIFQFREAED